MVKILNKLNEISQDKKVIIDFFAEWCGHCKRIAPQYIELSEKYSNIEFCKCDVDESSDLSEQFEVNALPTFIFLVNGKVVNKLEGADIEGLKGLIEELNKIPCDEESGQCDKAPVDSIDDKKTCDCNDKEICKDKETCNDKESCSCLK
jgi:thioredoxin 1